MKKAFAGVSASPVFEFQTPIRYSECDHRGRVTLPALINCFQDCCTFQSELVGMEVERLRERRLGWVLTHWHMAIDRYPAFAEMVTVGTHASSFKSVKAQRFFYMKDEGGECVVRGSSTWALMDLSAMRPLRLTSEFTEPYGVCEPTFSMPSEERRIALLDDMEPARPIEVLRAHIDTNEHVNNCQYVQMALDLLPADITCEQVRADYKTSAVLGDVIYPKLAKQGARTVVSLDDAKGEAYAVIELIEAE